MVDSKVIEKGNCFFADHAGLDCLVTYVEGVLAEAKGKKVKSFKNYLDWSKN